VKITDLNPHIPDEVKLSHSIAPAGPGLGVDGDPNLTRARQVAGNPADMSRRRLV
jgi:hypothetical protein